MLRRSNERRKCKQQTIEVIKLCLSYVLLFLTDFQTQVFGYPNTLLFYRGIKVHPCDLNAGTQLVYHLMNFNEFEKYLCKFIPNMSQKSAPLRQLLQNGPGDGQKMKHLKASRQQFHPQQSLSSSTPKLGRCRLMPVQRV